MDAVQSLQAMPDATLADAIVAKLCHVTRARSIEHAIEVGEIVVHGVYDGRLDALRGQGETHPLYRHIAAHRQLPLGPKRLWMCVKIYELVNLIPSLREASHLGVAHLRAVLTLPAHVQERLLTSAEIERWTSEQLEYEASTFRRAPATTGRPPTTAFLRGIDRIERLTRDIRDNLAPRVRGKLSVPKATVAKQTLRNVRNLLELLEEELSHLKYEGPEGANT